MSDPEPTQPTLAAYDRLKTLTEGDQPGLTLDAINRLVLREEMVRMIRRVTELENSLENLQDDNRREKRSLFLKLLPLLDSLDRIIRQTDPNNELSGSMESLRSQFLGVMEDQDIVPIEIEVGQPFDLTLCDISRRQERPDLPAETIVSVERRGYTYQSKVLRKARVVISTLPQEA